MKERSRRRFLSRAACIGGVGLSVLAGCSSRETTTPSPTESPATPTPQPNGVEEVTPRTLPLSEYIDMQEAISDAADFDTVEIDVDETFTDPIVLKSNLRVQGNGGTLRMDQDANTHGLRTENVQNVWINGVTIDGNRAQNSTGRIIGGFNLGSISNIRVTNCTIRNAGLHAINFSNDKQGEMQDIYIANNVITKPFSHGILCGGKSTKPNSLHDMIIENNTVTDVFNAQSIGVFGQNGCDTYNVAILGNTCVQNLKEENNDDTAIAFEEQVRDSIGYGNTIRMLGKDENGFTITKDGRGCIVGNNDITNCQFGLGCFNLDFYMPDGPPRHNLFTHNRVENCGSGFHYRNLDGDLSVYYNRMIRNDKVIDMKSNSGSGYFISQNGPTVPEVGTGVPDEIGVGVDYSANGSVIARARWDRGSPSPYHPVSVNAKTMDSQ
jgi:hypothetical protein